ncbi:hypothetical protein ACLOJK_003773 [Asimina triloba]
MLMEGHHGASTSKDIAATREVLLQTHDQISPLHPKGDLTFLISDDPELWVDARMGISCFSQTAVSEGRNSTAHLSFPFNVPPAIRLNGPDAYLSLLYLCSAAHSPVDNPQKFKWPPSQNFIPMSPPCGLLNLNAQPNMHIIHQKFQEMKKNIGLTCLNRSYSSSLDAQPHFAETDIKTGYKGKVIKEEEEATNLPYYFFLF